MLIDDLISEVKQQILFNTEEAAQQFLAGYCEGDQVALVSAMYIGRDHFGENEITPDYMEGLKSGDINRFWFKDIPSDEFAKILYEKSSNLVAYYDAFLRCTTNSGIDRNNF